jgi:hypothetical protein
MSTLRKTIGILLLTAYMFAGGYFLIGTMDHHHETSGCPFMPGEQVICQMDASDHISAWQSRFATVLPTILILSIIAAAVILTWRQWYPPPEILLTGISYQREVALHIVPIYQELFSRGLLNPKIP